MQTIETSTVYHTPNGDIEVPSPPITIPDVQATYESNLAPQYLIFPNDIFNMRHVAQIFRQGANIRIFMSNGREDIITVSDIDKTWSALQHAFAEGVKKGE